ncbi:MAG: VTT domain-containing protein [Acidobacteria bacterium]|nr:VTT domain-containing protein [Acidobacteriota bacterium]
MRWAAVFVVLFALILVPFVLFEDRFNALGDRLLHANVPPAYAAGAVVGFLTADVLLPIPSSVVSAGAGLILGFWRGAAAVWAGMTASCLVGYAFGAGAAGAARRFVGEGGMARAGALSARYGDFALVLCRPIPVLAEASVIVSGIVKRPFGRFVQLTTWANLGVAMGYAAIGAWSMRMESFLLAFLGSLLVPAIGMLASRWWFRRA